MFERLFAETQSEGDHLLDFLFFVSAGDTTTTEDQPLQKRCDSVISAQFPTDKHLVPDVAYFCQPEGTHVNSCEGGSAVRKDSSFVFTLTDKDTSKVRYGICHNFYLNTSDNDGNEQGHLTPQSPIKLKGNLTSMCILTNFQFISGFRTVLATLKKIIDSADRSCQYNYCKENENSEMDHYQSIWSYFTDRSNFISTGIHAPYIEVIENWITLLLDAPLPEVGKSCLALQLLPSVHSSITLALPDPTRLSLIDFPLHLPLELLGVNQCLKVLTCILLEKKVLVISRDYNALTMSVLALVSMLYPLEYMFPVIPLLPCLMPSSEQILLAPTPFVIGIPASFILLKKIQLPNDVWVIDLDANEIYQPKNEVQATVSDIFHFNYILPI